MKYVQINAYANGWADSIIFSKHRELISQGHESWVFWARGEHEQDDHMVRIASYPEVCLDVLQTRIDGKAGFHSKGITRRLLRKLNEVDPDVVHLHVLLGYYINVRMLLEWLAAHHCKVVWTLHDCWAFTGHCIHFTKVKCMQWCFHRIYDGKTGCGLSGPCPQRREYPETFAGDSSVAWCFEQKRRLFTMLPAERVQLITPSQWLADLVGQSFLSKYPVKVVHNTINPEVFRPTPSDFRERYRIGDRFMVLGVASKWSERKGLGDFVRLAGELDERFAVVLVGLSEKQIEEMPGRIVALRRTDTLKQLAEAHTAEDLILATSREKTFGMTSAEAASRGAPVAVVNGTACMEAYEGSERHVIASDLSDLVPTVIRAGMGRCLVVMFQRTRTTVQLAAAYTAADVFLNPTQEDNYPTVNLEAEACGCDVVTYDVGGCRETVTRPGSVVVGGYDDALRVLAGRG